MAANALRAFLGLMSKPGIGVWVILMSSVAKGNHASITVEIEFDQVRCCIIAPGLFAVALIEGYPRRIRRGISRKRPRQQDRRHRNRVQNQNCELGSHWRLFESTADQFR